MSNSIFDVSPDMPLAPVAFNDDRRVMSCDFFVKKSIRFVIKFLFSSIIIVLCMSAILTFHSIWLSALFIPILGIIYAHLVELQHECLHEYPFRSRRLNRIFGFACGIFMLNSFSHYKYDHLRHHAFLGTNKNIEFFNYRFMGLNNIGGFLRAAFNLGRYLDVFKDILKSISLSKNVCYGQNTGKVANKIRNEYRLFALIIFSAMIASLVFKTMFFIVAWLIPALCVSEALHFLIEMPEHYGLNTQSNPDVCSNTRSIKANILLQWLTNGNNMHTAHHYHTGVPICSIAKLYKKENHRFKVIENSYWNFYYKVIKGEIKHYINDTIMTR